MMNNTQSFWKHFYAATEIHRTEQKAATLVRQGYRRTSNKHCLASRIDRPDWREVMAQDHAPWDWQGAGLTWVSCLGTAGAADFYRRCLSKDTVKMTDEISRMMPSSNDDNCGYIHKPGDKNDG